MYLKNLTIHGFKSFANKIILEFPANLIGIVGPNGSGKSNISDGIKWVLGEQSSKALRGDKMEDVIFSGTSTVPASQAAEVKLIFDNKSKFFKNIDSDEFVLVRRLNRSGDSEYIINGENSRLKDIKEIIMDTGLGRDAYSIIGQGAVDNIITSRGNERRLIIEEAAGIVKYKAKKTDALRKVFEAQENVERVSLLIDELERTLTPLSFQAQIAHRYLLLDEQLKTAQKKKYVFDFDKLNADLAQSKAMALEYHRKRDEHQNKITIFTAEIEAARAKVVTLNDKNAQIKRDNVDVLIELEDLSAVDKDLSAKITGINVNRENYTLNADATREQIEKLEKANKEFESQIASAENILSSLKLNEKKTEEDIMTIEAKLQSSETNVNTSQDTTMDMLNQRSDAINVLGGYENELKFAKQKISELKFDIQNNERKMKDLEEKAKKGAGASSDNADKIDKFEKKLADIASRLRPLVEDEKALTASVQNDSTELVKIKATLEAQESSKKRFDGFKYGVKFILQQRQESPQRFAGLYGVVSELVKVAPEYETALEVALGQNMQSIVVEHAKDTEYCIELLNRNKAGRVTFLPMNTIRPQSPMNAPKNLYGFIGILSDIVKFDPKFKSIFEYLLGGAMLVDNLQHANEFTAFNRFSGRIVTLKGELINSSGAITGGSMDKTQTGGQFGGTENFEQLRSRVVYLDDKIKINHLKLDELRHKIAVLRSEEEYNKTELTKVRAAVESLEGSSMEYFQEYLKNYELEMSAMRDDIKKYQAQAAGLEIKVPAAQKVVDELSAKYSSMHDTVSATKDKFKKEREAKDRLGNELMAYRVDISSTAQKLNGLNQNLVGNKDEIIKLEKRLKIEEIELGKLNEKYRELRTQLDGIQAKLEGIRQRTGDIKAQEDAICDELKNLENLIRLKENLIAGRTKNSAEMLNKIHELDITQAQIEVSARNVLNVLELDFKIREDEFIQYRPEGFNPERNIEEIASLEHQILSLGSPNINAIKEHQDLVERVTDLKNQREDLAGARDNFYKIVEEIDVKCTKLFNETFNKINEHIGDIFQILFEGGSARLVLENPDKPLESNIDIKAQPPGKKLQSITLMSGGERSLTALSLLFAIMRVKPSPFCILDEVEAALDEANVLRLIRMLNKFREKTQFLIITHNKQTMQHLDLLFGVTMEERGISKIISVRLEEAYDIVDTQIENKAAVTVAG